MVPSPEHGSTHQSEASLALITNMVAHNNQKHHQNNWNLTGKHQSKQE
jgi:hypothetical protein